MRVSIRNRRNGRTHIRVAPEARKPYYTRTVPDKRRKAQERADKLDMRKA